MIKSSPQRWTLPNGETVEQALARCGITAQTLARRMKTSLDAAYRWKHGHAPSPVYRTKVIRALKAQGSKP